MGATSWIKIGIQLQPGEFAKITVILMDASIMARYNGHLDDLREYLKAVGLMLVPFFCIMTQPDLGTGLVYIFIAAVALVVGGARPKYLLITLAVGIALIAMVFVVDQIIYETSNPHQYKLLKQYQWATGLKTGSTAKAKYCLSATASKDGIDLIAVVMGAPDYKVRFSDAQALLNYGYSVCNLYIDENKESLPSLSVEGGVEDGVPVKYQGEFRYLDTQCSDK